MLKVVLSYCDSIIISFLWVKSSSYILFVQQLKDCFVKGENIISIPISIERLPASILQRSSSARSPAPQSR